MRIESAIPIFIITRMLFMFSIADVLLVYSWASIYRDLH